MKKWYDEEYEFNIEVAGFIRGNHTEHYCRNREEIYDRYTCTKVMMIMFPAMEAVRSGGSMEKIGGPSEYVKDIVCPDGCVIFRMTARPLGNENFFTGKYYEE